MPKYLFAASYTAEGTKGLLKEGGSSRRAMVDDMTKKMGGKLEAFYYALGDTDVYGIVDVPDAEGMMAVSLAVNAAGAVRLKTIPLMSPEEVDKAAKTSVAYRPPGK